MPPVRLLHPKYWPLWLGLGLLRMLIWLPHSLQMRMGSALGRLIRRLMGSRARVARRNLELCFPQWSEADRETLLQAHFANVGRMVFEIGLAWWGSPQRHQSLARVRGMELIEQARAQGQGVLLLFGHFTPIELSGRLLAYHAPMAALYREHGSEALEWMVRRQRGRYAAALFNRTEVRAAVRHLRRGGILWYAPDQDYERGNSVFAPFFGIPASTITSTQELARMGRARVFHTAQRRVDGCYEIEIRPGLEQIPSGDDVADATAVNAAIESLVRENPAQYLWLHRRFKNRPPGAASLY